MHTHTHVRMYTHRQTLCPYVNIYTHTCVFVHTPTTPRVYKQTWTHTQTNAVRIYVNIHTHTHVHTYTQDKLRVNAVCIYVNIYTHTCTFAHPLTQRRLYIRRHVHTPCIYVYTQTKVVCIHTNVYTHTYTCVQTQTMMRVYTQMSLFNYIHTYRQTPSVYT